jgi:hypothetical protein
MMAGECPIMRSVGWPTGGTLRLVVVLVVAGLGQLNVDVRFVSKRPCCAGSSDHPWSLHPGSSLRYNLALLSAPCV